MLGHYRRVLMIGAHPTTRTPAAHRPGGARRRGGYLSSGRADRTDAELGGAGLIRTESCSPRRLDGAANTRAYDFGYLSLEETGAMAPGHHPKDVVRIVRRFRPR
jgi:hypothetical protein